MSSNVPLTATDDKLRVIQGILADMARLQAMSMIERNASTPSYAPTAESPLAGSADTAAGCFDARDKPDQQANLPQRCAGASNMMTRQWAF